MGWYSFLLGQMSPNNRTFVQTLLGPLHPERPILSIRVTRAAGGSRVTPERLPVEIFLGHLTPALSHSVPLQQTRKFGISCLPKHTVTCCEYVLFVLCNLARSCYSSLQEPTSSHFSQPGSLDLLEPMPASLLLCKERMLTLVCNLCWSATSASDEKVPPNYYRRRNKRPQEPPEFLPHLGKSPCPRLQHRAVPGLLLIKL